MNDRLIDVEATQGSQADILTLEQREDYRHRLAEKLKDPEFRKIEGFPIGTDEAILALSDPPFYTACPNPFIGQWLAENSKPFDPDADKYHREPFAADVSEGKNHPIYNAHSYHTKVPHRAIMRYLLHYTEPGDIVYDGFCGTGMTGVAAQLCGDKTEIEALGSDSKTNKAGDYRVDSDGAIWELASWESKQALAAGRANPHSQILNPRPFSRLGSRKAILSDLSPSASFIAYNYNMPLDAAAVLRSARSLFEKVEKARGWMYSTLHRENGRWEDDEWEAFTLQAAKSLAQCQDDEQAKTFLEALSDQVVIGRINYVVWSDVFICPSCGSEILFWDVAVDKIAGSVLDVFPCPHCRSETTKGRSERKFASRFDSKLKRIVRQAVQLPVLVNYSVGKLRKEKAADSFDLEIGTRAFSSVSTRGVPCDPIPVGDKTIEPIRTHGLDHVCSFFTQRASAVIADLLSGESGPALRAAIIGGLPVGTKMSRFRVPAYFHGGTGPMKGWQSGTLYVPSLSGEQNWLNIVKERANAVVRGIIGAQTLHGSSIIQVASATLNNGAPCSVDYIFTDPPFGGNLQYSELSFLYESFLGVKTNNTEEAVENSSQGKELEHYQSIMTACFAAYYRALKPNRWMTVEFHNSANTVWNAIHDSLERVGFVVADVRVIDKQQYNFNQVTTSGATKKDLVISCYKPSNYFERLFEKHKGEPEGVKEFLEQHLTMLPVAPITQSGKLEQIAERTLGVLYDRMIAYHLVHNAKIPMSATQFGKLLAESYFLEDGMWFLADQIAQYQALKMRGAEPEQLTFYMQDEKSAVRWIRAELEEEQQTLGELTPKFMRELKEWPKTEPRPELRDLMREYFIQQNDGTWKIPDPSSEEDLAQIRREAMLKLFRTYATEKTKLGTFRKEAMIEGFKFCWETRQFGVIVRVCRRIKPSDLQSDRELLQFFEIAKDMVPEDGTGQLEMVWD